MTQTMVPEELAALNDACRTFVCFAALGDMPNGHADVLFTELHGRHIFLSTRK